MSRVKLLVIPSSFTSMEENMRTNVSKGGCEASGHWGIKSDGSISMGEHMPCYSYKSPPMTATIKVLLFGDITGEMWDSLDYLVAMNSMMIPSLEVVTSSDPTLRAQVEDRYGRGTTAGEMP
jgi:hypothetical protein